MHTPDKQGGPLFLKLLLNQLIFSNKECLQNLVDTTLNYNIKTMTKSKDILEVIKFLSSITNTIIFLCDKNENPLHELYVQNNQLNNIFSCLAEDLKYTRLYNKTVQSNALTAQGGAIFLPSTTSTGLQLDILPESAAFLWSFACETCKELKERWEWDTDTKTKWGSTFVTQPTLCCIHNIGMLELQQSRPHISWMPNTLWCWSS